MRTQLCAIVVSFLLTLSSGAVPWPPPAPPGATEPVTTSAGPYALRGFGTISGESVSWQTPQGRVSVVRLTCENPEKARITAAKYLADLLGFGAVARATGPGTVLTVRHGGTWRLGLADSAVYIASAADATTLAAQGPAWGAADWQDIPEHAYPRWLDGFDNAGLGIWISPRTRSPEQLAWFKNYPAVANVHRQSVDMSPAPGVYDTSCTEHALAYLKPLGKAYRYQLFAGMGDAAWFDWMQMPGEQVEQMMPGYLGRDFFRQVYYRHQVTSELVSDLMLDSQLNLLRRRVADPDLLGYLEPHGEFSLKDGMMPPAAMARFRAFLREVKKCDLRTVSQAYTGAPETFRSWDDVEMRDDAWFAGRRGAFVDLDDVPWGFRPENQANGIAAGFAAADFDDAGWYRTRRTDIRLLGAFDSTARVWPLWIRFTHDLPAEFARGPEKSYLHLMPLTEKDGRVLSVWINGKPVVRDHVDRSAPISAHVAYEVTDFIRPGANQFTVYSHGGRIAYRVFLSKLPMLDFPFADNRLNRQYVDRQDFFIHAKFQILERFLKAMRSIDPNRPIKVMTPMPFQDDAMELFEKYGAYPQLTGEGAFFRPMHYKGYARLRRLPGSSEPGGPSATAPGLQHMFACILFESQDAHDYMTDLDAIWESPEARKYWTDNAQLLSTIGKTDFIAPRLGLLRDLRQSYRYSENAIWNWDLSRGPFPALGVSPVLIGGGELEKGMADHVPVVFDCGTVIADQPLADAITRYVAGGGTFVAQHHTGRHTPDSRDSWQLAAAFGLKVTPKLLNDQDFNKSPLGKIRFATEQKLFPSLQGKSCEGSGVSINSEGKEESGAIAIRGEKAIPIATWDDGTMAIAEVKFGKGRFILLGTPFYVRFRDQGGNWINEADRQRLVAELLTALGIKLDTRVSDPRVWFERRQSKNGLYDVYLACAMGWGKRDFAMTERLSSQLAAVRPGLAPAIETSAAGLPDVNTSFADGQLAFGDQSFSPFQVRQFAVVRDDAGGQGPLHWLAAQHGAWRALQPVAADELDKVAETRRRYAAELGEAGLDISSGWRVQVDPTDTTEVWLTADPAAWREAGMGSWLTQDIPGAKTVRYRKRVGIPADWREARVTLGLAAWRPHGVSEQARLWVNGTPHPQPLQGQFQLDVTAAAATGVLELAMEVTTTGKKANSTPGPAGTLYLRKTPQPRAALDLAGAWQKLDGWLRNPSADVTLPGTGKAFGLRRTIVIPKEWAGRPVRLLIDIPNDKVNSIILNDDGVLFCGQFTPLGPRIDRWLRPGQENVIDLYGRISDRAAGRDSALNYDIKSIRLERY